MSNIFPSEEHRTQLLATLRMLGAASALVEFSGSGDSGSIQDVVLHDSNGNAIDISQQMLLWPVETQHMQGNTWVKSVNKQLLPLEKILERITYEALEDCQLDWYNNDGGQGVFEINLTTSPPEIRLDVGINTMSTEDHRFTY